MKLKNIAVKVNNEQFKIVQKIAFHHGCTWDFNGLVKGESEQLYINKNSQLSWKQIKDYKVFDFIDFVTDFHYDGLFTYPLYKINKDKSVIIKFTSHSIGECVYSNMPDYNVSKIYVCNFHFSDDWVDISEDKAQNYINYGAESWLEANKEVLKISNSGLVVEFVNDNDGRVLYVDERTTNRITHFVSDEIQENWINRNNPCWSDITYEELEILKHEQKERLLIEAAFKAAEHAEKSKRSITPDQCSNYLEEFSKNDEVIAQIGSAEIEAFFVGVTNFGEIIVKSFNGNVIIVDSIKRKPNTTKEVIITYLTELLTDKLYDYEDEINKAIRLVQRLKD